MVEWLTINTAVTNSSCTPSDFCDLLSGYASHMFYFKEISKLNSYYVRCLKGYMNENNN